MAAVLGGVVGGVVAAQLQRRLILRMRPGGPVQPRAGAAEAVRF